MAENAGWKRYREWAGREALRQQTIDEQRAALERAAEDRAKTHVGGLSNDRYRSTAHKLDFHPAMVCRLLPSRPEEFRLEPLTDPDLILSHHPARIIAPRLPPSVETSGSSRFDPVGPTQRR